MTTGQVLGRLTRGKHVFATDRTVVLVLVLETVVCVKDIDADAHAAFSAVTKGLHATDSAKTAFGAMKGFFGSSHPKIAKAAMIFTKHSIASCIDAQVSVAENGREEAE